MSKRPAFIYARVSDPGKGDRSDPTASIPRQRAELKRLAAANGDVVLEVFEEAQTAHEGGRAEYERMMGRLDEVKAVYVVAYDRLTRIPDPSEQEKIRKLFVAARVDIVTPSYTFRYSDPKFDSPETRLHQRALGMFGAFEWDSINRRMRKGKLARVEQGMYYGHPVPYGYTVTYDPASGAKRFEVDEAHAQVVRNVFQLYVEGFGSPAIARELTMLGIPSPYQRPWSADHIRNMLRQDLYIGRSTFGSKTRSPRPVQEHVSEAPVVVPSKAFAAIVEPEVWERAQQQRQARTTRRERPTRSHLLTGILVCPTCFTPCMSHGTWSKSTLPPYYACRRVKTLHAQGLGVAGHSAYFNMNRANEVLHKWLLVHLPRYAAGKHRKKQAPKPRAPEMVDVARRRVAELDRQWGTVATFAEQGIYEPEEARKRFEALRAEIKTAKSHLDALSRTQQAEASTPIQVEGMIEKLRAIDPQALELREFYTSLLAEVRMKKGAKRGRDIPLTVERVRFVSGEWYPSPPPD